MKVRTGTNNQVDATVYQLFDRNILVELVSVHDDRQVALYKTFQQVGEDQEFEVLRCANIKSDLFFGRVKDVDSGMTQVDVFYDVDHMAVHAGGLAGRPHGITGVDEQLVLEAGPQLFQAVAHGGLADAKGFGNLGDAALLIYGDENHEVLHVQLSEQIAIEHKIRLDKDPWILLFVL